MNTLVSPSNGNVVVTAKSLNGRGQYEVIESSDSNRVPVGAIRNSLDFDNLEVGSIWRAEIRITNKGSFKVESVAPIVATEKNAPSPVAPVAPIVPSVEVETTVEDAPIEVAKVKKIAALKPGEPMQLSKDVMNEWQELSYYISPDARQEFAVAYNFLRTSPYAPVKMLFTGPSGYGKTTLAEKFAHFAEFDFLRVNCATMRDTTEWFGMMHLRNGDTTFEPSQFVEYITRGNCVIVLDEFNRVQSDIHNSLFPLLDDSAKTQVYGLDITVGPNVIFVATINEGFEYGGTFELDEAIKNRFELILEVGPMPFDYEIAILESRYGIEWAKAESIVKLATQLRDNGIVCSTRSTLLIAKMVSVGLSVRDAFEYSVIRRITNNESNAPLRKSIVDIVNNALGVRDLQFSSL